MATEHQVALTRPPRLSATNVPKSTRQAVPAFLQKLYEMVNDQNTNDIICWSEAGDSFFVLDQERLSREVLGRWFKHQNFSSFVRQLNMYGFHKIPHLQQGVLRSETETELWNFINPNFHRDQPDLLCFISRKKQTAQLSDDLPVDSPESNAATPSATPNTGQTQGQVFDVNSFVQSIAAIKRHQTAISSELNELKRSNQLLWQDAITARARHQKQQDTINRILKFLAGVFGNHAAGNHHKDDVVDSPNSNHRAVVPRRRTRLLIEGAQHEPSGKVGIIQVEDPDANTIESNEFPNTAAYPYPTIETPASIPSPAPSVAPSDGTSPKITEANYFGSVDTSSLFAPHGASEGAPRTTDLTIPINTQPPRSDENPPSPSIATTTSATPTAAAPSPNNALERAATPNRSPTFEIDPRVQHLLNNLSPDQLTHLVNSLSQADTDYTQDLPQNPADTSHLWFDYGLTPSPPPPSQQQQPSSHTIPSSSPSSPFPLLPAVVPSSSPAAIEDGLVAFDNLHVNPSTLSHKLERHWQAAEDIDKDVNAINTHINHFIESMGLNPGLFHAGEATPTSDPTSAAAVGNSNDPLMSGTSDADTASGGGVGHDFDFASFLNTLDSGSAGGIGGGGDGIDMDYNDSVSTAFLDEVPSPSDGTGSPVAFIQRPLTPLQSASANALGGGTPTANSNTAAPRMVTTPTTATATGGGRKRKSDVVMSDLGEGLLGREVGAGKTKRRKD